MALVFADGFDLYASTADVRKSPITTSNATIHTLSTSAGRYGGGCLVRSADGGTTTWAVPTGILAQGSTIHFGFHYYVVNRAAGGATDPVCELMNNSATRLFRLEHDAGGNAKVFGQSAAQVGSTASGAFSNAAWHWIEAKIVLGTTDSNGEITVHVNGVQIVNVTGVDTFSGSTLANRGEYLTLRGSGGGSRFDDVMVWDTSGSSFNGYPLGESKIDTLIPNGDGTATSWTRSTGSTNFTLVDDVLAGASNDDTDYLSSSTVGHKTDLLLSNLADNPITIHAVQARVRARKEDAGTRTIRTNIKRSASVTNGSELGPSTEYSWRRHTPVYLDPGTASAFTTLNINALELQLEVVQ